MPLFLHVPGITRRIRPKLASDDPIPVAIGLCPPETSEIAYEQGMRKVLKFIGELDFEQRRLRAHRIAAEVRERRGMKVFRMYPLT